MERYDMTWQPKSGTNVQHVLAVIQNYDVDVVRMIMEDEPEEFFIDQLRVARGVCIAIGLRPDGQPVTLIEDVYQDDRGYAIRAEDDFLFAMMTMWLGHEPDWSAVEFIPPRLFEKSYVNVTPDDEESGDD